MLHTEPDFSRTDVLNGAKSASSKPTRALTHEWADEVQPKTFEDELVEDLITANSLNSVIGFSGSGKTNISLNLAVHIATGQPWFGRAVKKGLVAYFALEGLNSLRKRGLAHRIHMKMEGEKFPLAFIGASLNLYSEKSNDTDLLIAKVKELESSRGELARLVVIDTLNLAMPGGNENSSQDMGGIIANLHKIRVETGAAVMIVHHTGKDSTKGARGHSSLHASVDTELTVADGTIKETKERDREKGESMAFQLISIEIDKSQDGKTVTSCVPIPITRVASFDGYGRLSEGALQAYNVLIELLETEGTAPPSGVRCSALRVVSADRWRQRFQDVHCPGLSKQARYERFKRASTELFSRNKVATESAGSTKGGFVWLVKS